MNLMDRLRIMVRAALDDLFGEEYDTNPGRPEEKILDRVMSAGDDGEDRLPALLDDAQTRLDNLRTDLSQARARQYRSEQDWQQAMDEVTALNQAVDTALRSNQEEQASTLLLQVQRQQTHARTLGEYAHQCREAADQLEKSISEQQNQLLGMRRKYIELIEREQSAAAQEELNRVRKELNKQANSLASDLEAREEKVVRREDRLAAEEDLRNHSGG